MKKSAMLTSKRTYQRNIQAKMEEIRKTEKIAMMRSTVIGSEVGQVLNSCSSLFSTGYIRRLIFHEM